MKNVWDMPIDQTVEGMPVNDVAGPVNDVTTAIFDMPGTSVTTAVTDIQPLSVVVSSSKIFIW